MRIKTNEERLLALTGTVDAEHVDLARMTWTIIADAEMSPELGDPLVLDGGPVSFLSFGQRCRIAVDHEQKEITGFVSARISDAEWSGVIVATVLAVIAEGSE